MSIDPDKKGSLLGALADEYQLPEADADRLLASVQAQFARDPRRVEAASSPVAPAAAVSGSGRKALWFGVSCLTLAIGGAVVVYSPPEQPHVVATSPAPLTVPSGEAKEPESAPTIPAVSIDQLPSVASTPAVSSDHKRVVAKAAASSSTSTPASPDTLERETVLLEGARQALKQGDGTRALSLLDEHARLFPNGWLASDRAGERIIVLCSLGKRDEATREAAAFLDGRPKSPLTRRVEMSCAGQAATKAQK